MFDAKNLVLLVPLAQLAFADLELDRDNVPPPCRDICQPLVELTARCEVDIRGATDREEDRLEMQCVCTNDSFDVERVAGLCASCFQQNLRTRDNDDEDDDSGDDDDDDDSMTEWDDDDIQEIMRNCGFKSMSYSSQATTAVQSVSVEATAPTETGQLTTTVEQGSRSGDGKGGSQTTTSNGAHNTEGNNDDNENDSASEDESDNNGDDDSPGVHAAVPFGGVSGGVVLGLVAAVAVGNARLL